MSRGKGRARRESGHRTQRQLRVGEVLRHALTEILDRGIVRDPDLAGVAVTVSEVRLGPDLRNATVYVMPLGGDDCDIVVEALRRATPFLRRNLAARLTLKYVPNLSFEPDTTFDYAGRIGQLLNDARPDPDPDPETETADSQIDDDGA
jgi:ribosome-binding factor A